MAYGTPGFSFADSASIDAFGRGRVSQPVLLIDTKQVNVATDMLTSSLVTQGGGSGGAAAYQANRSSTYLTLSTGTTGVTARQSKARAIYQPGKSVLAFVTFIMAPAATNLVQRVGLFDSNNGLFLQLGASTNGGSTLYFVRRTFVSGSAVDNATAQSSWNYDKMDGTGPSGQTLDITKPQILIVDLEWLGVGRVRYGFVINGNIYYCHRAQHANAALTSVYMSNPNLPLRWEISAGSSGAVAGNPVLESICGSVNSEGGYDNPGGYGAADAGNTGRSIANGSWSELVAVRIQSAYASSAIAYLQSVSVSNDATKNASGSALYRVILNPTASTGGAWSSVTNSVMEQNTTRTGSTGAPNASAPTGVVLDSGYFGVASIQAYPRVVLPLGQDLSSNLDVYSLQVQNVSLGTVNFYGSLTWREIT